MKLATLVLLAGFFLLSSCLEEDVEDTTDRAAPTILANEGQSTISPEYFFEVAPDATEIPLAFTVQDERGIREIKIESHSGFDGHTHARTAMNFTFFSHAEVVGEESFEDPTRFTSTAARGLKIYLDHRNPAIGSDNLILAGPYHFSIKATDVEGNETSYRDNSTYHTTLFIHRSYAPQIEVSELDISGRTLSGRVARNTSHEASSDLAFLWIYIEERSPTNPQQEGQLVKEWLWGSSNWPHQSRPNQGKGLPDHQQLDLEELLDDGQDFFQRLEGNKLVIWAEDAKGNVSVKQFNP